MIELMERENEARQDVPSADKGRVEPPTAYIPACGTLCDAFWWARRSVDPEKSSD
jgi:hypothetical protein